ncbi:MAG TPA: nucleoside phosphorylase [Actinomycetospora sp.]|uniref:nucleoside phosphorylase n=1 Tax=Actinomycetospora sp. TaxID=1872135 RepID=UPI002F41EDDA
MTEPLPLGEDDLADPGLIAPGAMRTRGSVPPDVVLCFFPEVVAAVAERAREAAVLHSENGRSPVLVLTRPDGTEVGVVHPGVGAPMAAVTLEELVVLGGRRFTAVGGAGVLVPELVLGHAVVVDSALRDEGTSFHYLAPGRTVEADPDGVAALAACLRAADVAHTVGRTWTTDAVYRETRGRTDRRRAEGCLTVEMEAAALIAVARFRGVAFSQVLFAGDSLAGQEWDHRRWTTARDARRALVEVVLGVSLP